MTKKDWCWQIVKAVLVVGQLVVSVMLLASMISMGVLPNWIVALIGILLALFLIINIVFLLVRRKTNLVGQIICALVAIIVMIAGIIAVRYTGAFNAFLGKVTERTPEVKEYSVLVLNTSPAGEIKDLNNKSAGFLKTDSFYNLAENELKKVVSMETDAYDDIFIIDEMMDNSLLDAIVLESGWLEMMQDELEEIFVDKRIIYTFEIEVDGDISTSQKDVTREPFLIYISGSDSRNGLKATARSDVNIIVAVNPVSGKLLLVSVPRDAYVQLHGTTGLKDKLTHAGLYGVNMSKATLEDLFNIKIDHTIKIGFEGVVKLVDALGGIEINSDVAMTLKNEDGSVCKYVKGKQWVDGKCALRFARERKTYGTGDLHRGANQQEILTAIISKLSGSKDYVLKMPEILNAASDAIETSLSYDNIASFIRLQLAEQPKWQVESVNISGDSAMLSTYSLGDNYPRFVMILDDDSVVRMTEIINSYLKE